MINMISFDGYSICVDWPLNDFTHWRIVFGWNYETGKQTHQTIRDVREQHHFCFSNDREINKAVVVNGTSKSLYRPSQYPPHILENEEYAQHVLDSIDPVREYKLAKAHVAYHLEKTLITLRSVL